MGIALDTSITAVASATRIRDDVRARGRDGQGGEPRRYLSWYDAGIRVIRFGESGIEEVGHYVDANGNDIWGVQAHRLPGDPTETTYILGSDRDSGLWIFRYTGG